MITIRPEKSEDFNTIYKINKKAFNGEVEARLIDKIRQSDNFVPELSLVALKDDKIVGHILFSRVKIKIKGAEKLILALAPIAVLPELQKKGIGSLLVKKGLQTCKGFDYDIIVVIGHPEFFPRFGFTPARKRGLEVSFGVEIPSEAFMVCELKKDALKDIRGIIEFPSYFEDES